MPANVLLVAALAGLSLTLSLSHPESFGQGDACRYRCYYSFAVVGDKSEVAGGG